MSKANIMIQKNLIIPQLVVSHPVLNWNQKAILTLIIQHHQTHHDQRFTMKDKEIAKELGMKLGSVSTIIGQLFELGIIDKDVDSVQIQKGSKNKNVRYIWVESLDVWITGSQLPTITPRSQEELAERTKKQFKDANDQKSTGFDLDKVYNYEEVNGTIEQINLAIEQYKDTEPTLIHSIKASLEGEEFDVEAFEFTDKDGITKLMLLESLRDMVKYYKKHPKS
jgi:hypothetical protein